MINFQDKFLRLRPSVSFVPLPDKNKYQFFLSDIRQSFNLEIRDEKYIEILANLNGSLSFSDLLTFYNLTPTQKMGISKFFELLIDRCVLEDTFFAEYTYSHPFRRVLNFISSYVPFYKINDYWEKIEKTNIILIGAGGVGSWVISMLAQLGIKNFFVLDDDIVKLHNLNRSLFKNSDIGKYKAQALKEMLDSRIQNYYTVDIALEKLSSPEQLTKYLEKYSPETIIINCADYPSVAHTSAIITESAFARNLPHIIAGGYNMHLSLIGPTIIPRKTPCFHCISHGLEELHISELENAERIVKEHRNIGNLAPLASISASFVANEALKLMLNIEKIPPTMFGKRGEFNYLTKKLNLDEYHFWDKCPCCGKGEYSDG